MTYVVPAEKTDPKAQMIDVTDMPEVIAFAKDPDSYMRLVEKDGRQYAWVSDMKKLKGEDFECLPRN